MALSNVERQISIAQTLERCIHMNISANFSAMYPILNLSTYSSHASGRDNVYVQRLAKYIAPKAQLEKESLNVYALQGKKVYLINYTAERFEFKGPFELYINSQFLLRLTAKNCHMLAYTVIDMPEVICLDRHDDDAAFPVSRQYIFKGGYGFLLKGPNCTIEMKSSIYEALFAVQQQPQLYDDEEAKKNMHIQAILEKLPKEAVLVKRPSYTSYQARGNSWEEGKNVRLTVINHTSQHISFDVTCGLRINGRFIGKFPEEDSHIMAFNLTGHTDFICLIGKDKNKEPGSMHCYAPSWVRASEQEVFLLADRPTLSSQICPMESLLNRQQALKYPNINSIDAKNNFQHINLEELKKRMPNLCDVSALLSSCSASSICSIPEQDYQVLLKNKNAGALLTSNPQKTSYRISNRLSTNLDTFYKYTFINHSDQEIAINSSGDVCINKHNLSCCFPYMEKDILFLVYHIVGLRNALCVDYVYRHATTSDRFFFHKDYDEVDYSRAVEMLRIVNLEQAFALLWMAKKDAASLFFNLDPVMHIITFYLKLGKAQQKLM